MRDQLVKAYLWLLIVLVPMDQFGPTSALLREGGAKPAIPLMMLASLVLLGKRYEQVFTALPASSALLAYRFLGIFACSLLAFTLNLIFGWSRFDEAKDPLIQFVTQAALFALTPLIIILHAELFRDRRWPEYIIGLLPWAVGIHLAALLLNIAGLLVYNRFPLSLFRTGSEEVSMRISGLFSEPSYFGTMAAMYGIPLLMIYDKRSKRGRRLLAVVLFSAALYTGGKTVIPVSICGFIGYSWYDRTRLFTVRKILAAATLGVISVGIVVAQSALDVRENLSSAMRFGSTLTSINVAIAGYGIMGVGFGQFHFMFLRKFMPAFLLFSEEAVNQMASSAAHRTSTFNLFTRYLVETGLMGLFLFIAWLRDLCSFARDDRQVASLLGILLVSTSLGFLLTQEPYCYPPLMLGAALILGAHNQRPPTLAHEVVQ